MLKNILQTVGARYVAAFLNFVLIFINSKVLGLEVIGMMGMILAVSGIAFIFNSILCGNTIVYFMNRYNLKYVFYPAYIWAIIGSATACGVMSLLKMLPDGYGWAVFGLATLMSLVSANTHMLLGKDKIKSFNLISVLQSFILFVFVVSIYYIGDYRELTGWLAAMFISYGIAFAVSLILLVSHLKKSDTVSEPFFAVLRKMFVYGLWSGIDSLAEGLTTRLNYFIINSTGGYIKVGLLDSGTKVSESVWHISNSISYLEYNSVSKTTDIVRQKRVTLQLFKLTFCVMTAVITLITCIPETIFTDYLLTNEFVGVGKVISGLAPGIVAYGSNRILTHFFVGSGRIVYSAYCSILGLIALIATGFFLIPMYGVVGAAITVSISHISMLIFSVSAFKTITHTTFKEMLPSKDDFRK
ncbi:MAG: polysaccharide biosynthesis C-terminal domain-containing protein [Tannerella sp.]|jgi:O-antigen/teichoic acid export membrane protein|nr:polysaccharide biosynthesis C-terminal domain-containing protein [Tannerella sp.]